MPKKIEPKETTQQTQKPSDRVISLILNEIENYKTSTIDLTDKVSFSQHNTIQDCLTHQNKGFLTEVKAGQNDDREFYDIVSPMIETAVVNTDLDTDNIEPYVDDNKYLAQEYFARSALKNYLRQTNHGIVLNETLYQFIDDGNIIVRKVDDKSEIYRPVLPQNLYVVNQSAKSLEETAVIEKAPMNQTQVREMEKWANHEKIYELCNVGEDSIPYYDIYYRFGELSVKTFKELQEEIHGNSENVEEGDGNKYIQTCVVMAEANSDLSRQSNNNEPLSPGVIAFVEKLIPEEIKVTKKIKIKRYKPYASARLGKFTGRFWGLGYREIGMPYQNRANEIGNKLRKIMNHASNMAWWSDDDEIAGKSVITSFKMGQIIKVKPGRTLNVLNNTFPNFSLFVEEWNRNITECEKALKAFEVATGESLPSSTSATAIGVQNQAVGKYWNFKREKFGLFISEVFKRWVLKDILTDLEKDDEAIIELVGDAQYFDEIIDLYIKGWIIQQFKSVALSGGYLYQENVDQLKELKKQELLKEPKLFGKIMKDFFKDIELYVGINTTGEAFNKQAMISNSLQLLEYELNPAIVQNPQAMDTLNQVKQMLGLRFRRNKMLTNVPVIPNQQPTSPQLPQKEQSLQATGNPGNKDNASML